MIGSVSQFANVRYEQGQAQTYPQHEVPDVAEALYNLMHRLTGLGPLNAEEPPDEFAGLSVERQLPWLTLASKGPALLERCEGQSMAEAASRLFALANHEDSLALAIDPAHRISLPGQGHSLDTYFKGLEPKIQLAWQALTKFLFALIDCEDPVTLDQAAGVMYEWYVRKCLA